MTVDRIKEEIMFGLECENEVLEELGKPQKEIEITVKESELFTVVKTRLFVNGQQIKKDELTLKKSGAYLQSTTGKSTKEFVFNCTLDK